MTATFTSYARWRAERVNEPFPSVLALRERD